MEKQITDADWLDFHPAPKRPDFVLPEGAVDAHCHVFGPREAFPFAPERKYTPCDAGKDKLFELRDYLGFSRNVIVQATCHGTDNAALVDACRAGGARARGVASVRHDISRDALAEMDSAGVRGVRFNFVRRLVEATPRAHFVEVAERIQEFGWSIVVYFEAADLAGLAPFLAGLPGIVVVDHMGRPDIAKGVEHEDFGAFIRLMQDNPHIWTKVTCPERLSVAGPPGYGDVVPFAARIVELFPDRVLWGTDWPHPNMTSHMPDDGNLVDFIPRIAPDAEVRRKLLVDNPMRLYWAR
ncbi:MAG: 2-pyrone-4,6-dicarboxylate hydrolase [Rhodobacterales bacterium]|nr:MAG: 2-pyrone-4,6-dicarboxylate hydrolase [Rhodobacterales bacterium]